MNPLPPPPQSPPRVMAVIVVPLALALASTTGCDRLHARVLAREAVELYHRGETSESAAKLAEAVRLDDKTPVILLNLGTSNVAIFRTKGAKSPDGQAAAERAIQAYRRYLELRPNDERVKLSLVQTFVDANRYDDAVSFFRPAVDKTPPDPQALRTLAVVAAKCGRFDEARKWHERRIAAEPLAPDAYLALGALLWEQLHGHATAPPTPSPERSEARRQMVNDALAALNKAIELNPAAPNAYTYVNLVYREQANDEATEDGKRVALEEANRHYRMALERQGRGF